MTGVLVEQHPPLNPRLLTAADLAAMPSELPSGPVKYELDDGRIVPIALPADDHGRMQHRIGRILDKYAEARGVGEAYSEVGVILRRNPDRVVGPDAALVLKRSLPVRMSAEGYLETIPELVVEIRSKNDTLDELHEKSQEYLQAGVQIVWVIDPASKTVTIFRTGEASIELRGRDALTAAGVVEGFNIPVSELFGE